MHYKLLGFSQLGTVRTFWFHRIGAMGTVPVPFRVLADTSVARKYNVALQEMPSLCSRMLNATAADTPAGTRILAEQDISMYAAELDLARAEADAARKRRALQCSQMGKAAEAARTVDSTQSPMPLTAGE
jgi:hypothetical protein